MASNRPDYTTPFLALLALVGTHFAIVSWRHQQAQDVALTELSMRLAVTTGKADTAYAAASTLAQRVVNVEAKVAASDLALAELQGRMLTAELKTRSLYATFTSITDVQRTNLAGLLATMGVLERDQAALSTTHGSLARNVTELTDDVRALEDRVEGLIDRKPDFSEPLNGNGVCFLIQDNEDNHIKFAFYLKTDRSFGSGDTQIHLKKGDMFFLMDDDTVQVVLNSQTEPNAVLPAEATPEFRKLVRAAKDLRSSCEPSSVPIRHVPGSGGLLKQLP